MPGLFQQPFSSRVRLADPLCPPDFIGIDFPGGPRPIRFCIELFAYSARHALDTCVFFCPRTGFFFFFFLAFSTLFPNLEGPLLKCCFPFRPCPSGRNSFKKCCPFSFYSFCAHPLFAGVSDGLSCDPFPIAFFMKDLRLCWPFRLKRLPEQTVAPPPSFQLAFCTPSLRVFGFFPPASGDYTSETLILLPLSVVPLTTRSSFLPSGNLFPPSWNAIIV